MPTNTGKLVPPAEPSPTTGETRQRILQAAAQTFAEKGYARATTRAIAAAAGINEVTLFRHFGNKRNLLAAVIDQYSALPDLAATLEEQLTGNYHQDLLHLGHQFLKIMTERREAVRLLLCEADHLPEVRQIMVRIPRQLRQLLARYLQRQMKQGRARNLNPELMAQAFFGMFFSYSLTQAILADPAAPEMPPEKLVAEFVDIFVHGTISPEGVKKHSRPQEEFMESAITLGSVTRRFGDLVAVDNLSFEVQRGEIFGLLGPNGAGKTTTINLITGLLRRHSGEVRVLGFDPETEPRQVRQIIGLVPQETNVYADLSAVDNLWHHAALYCSDLGAVKKRIEELLRLVELWERRKDRVETYSGGMKRRLALARALLHDPQIILFDEPTLGVDVQGRHVIWEHIKAQQDQGKTFVVSTNYMTEADALCDRLVIIDHGQAIAVDTPERLKAALGRDIVALRTTPVIEDPGALFAGLGVQAIARTEPDQLRLEVRDAETIVGELVTRVAAAYRLESVRIARPSLDDVFLHHTGRALRE